MRNLSSNIKKENLLSTRIWFRIIELFGVLAAIATGVMAVSVVSDIVSRDFTNRAIPGVLEFGESLMVVVVFLSLAWTQRQKGHVRVTAILSRFSENKQSALNLWAWGISLIMCVALAIAAVMQATVSIEIGEFLWGIIQFPIWPARIVIAGGLILLCIQFLVDIAAELHQIFRRRHSQSG
ncbi:TRAP transporter small permease subunit [Chloroflexota bacterium]